MTYEERLKTACGCTECMEIGAQADARIAELEAENKVLTQLVGSSSVPGRWAQVKGCTDLVSGE